MSGASDKARFYLEQAVPQLREFEEKKIFAKEEIRNLVKKRSDFEHKVLARGSTAVDFARYAAWEISLEKLRAKRCKRLKIKGSSSHAGQARIFSIFERGTRKHFGDLGLWVSYIQYAREVGAIKRFKTVLTAALRMHCTKTELWLYAAKWTLEEESDIEGARGYMQRGIRFCNTSKDLWIEYAKLEMIFLARVDARRQALGLDVSTGALTGGEQPEETRKEGFEASADVIAVPRIAASSLNQSMMDGVKLDTEAVRTLMATPALNGAIPIAIFDDARKQPFYNANVAEAFFNMFGSFTTVSCQARVLQHVLDTMVEKFPDDPCTISCLIRRPVISVDPLAPEFPAALGQVLEILKVDGSKASDRGQLARKVHLWMDPWLKINALDHGIRLVVSQMLRNLE